MPPRSISTGSSLRHRAQRLAVSTAPTSDTTSIVSFHDFDYTPDTPGLEDILERAQAAGADIVKIAVHCNDLDDLRRLAAFTIAHADQPLITIGMGPHGAVSRMLFPALGSLITYAYVGTPSAPGRPFRS